MDLNFLNYNFKEIAPEFLIKLFTAGVVFIISWWLAIKLAKIIRKAMIRAKIESSVISFTFSVSKVAFRTIAILITLSCLGINISSLIAALGAALVTVGLALKDSLSNIASGTIIIINHPFKIGDYLEIEKFSGVVVKIEIMFTTLIDEEGSEIIIPNSKLTSTGMKNKGKKKPNNDSLELAENN